VKALTTEYIEVARRRLLTAREIAARDPATALSAPYYAALYAARAALHEHGVAARSHRGVWHEFRQRMVTPGPVDPDLASAIQRLQTSREQADYDALDGSTDDAEQAIEIAARFVDQVAEHLTR
jgi:uncharacterized protein (UPF0332 family)